MSEFVTRRWLPGPAWLHFLVFGLMLHLASGWLFPEPLPILGPPNPVRLQLLQDGYARMAGKMAGEEERARFVDMELRNELLFREAIARDLHLEDSAVSQRLILNMHFLEPDSAMSDEERIQRGLELNMHLTDEVIRRRLVQVMEGLLVAARGVPPVTEAELRAEYEARRGEFVAPATVSFSHVFLGEVDRQEALARLADIRASALSPEEALSLGTSFLAGYAFDEQRWLDVTGRFGRVFTDELRQQVDAHMTQGGAGTPAWLEPVASVFGLHLVYVRDASPARPQTLEEVSGELRWELRERAEQAVLDQQVARLMAGYEVRRS